MRFAFNAAAAIVVVVAMVKLAFIAAGQPALAVAGLLGLEVLCGIVLRRLVENMRRGNRACR